MADLRQELLRLQAVRDLIGEVEYKRREQALLDPLTGAGASPGTTQHGGSILDLGTIAGQAIFIGPPNRRYRIERSLGKGSFGEVFLAEDVETTKQLGAVIWRAVKMLHKKLAADELSRKRLTQEAEQVKALRHKHIVAVYDWSIDPVQDTPFLVMEYLKGRSLSGVLADRLGSGGYTLAEALELLRPVAQALDYAWAEHKLVHRDLKPDNLVITEPGGVIKLLDFGLAARMRSTASNAGIAVLERAGTLDYAPPEAAAKQKAWQPSHDVYSLAVVLYQLLDPEHELPFAQRAPGTPWPARPEGLSDAQWEVLKQGLAYRQEERMSRAGAFLEELEAAGPRDAGRKAREGAEWVQEAERKQKEFERKAREEVGREREAQQRRDAEEARIARQAACEEAQRNAEAQRLEEQRLLEEKRKEADRTQQEKEFERDEIRWRVALAANSNAAYRDYLLQPGLRTHADEAQAKIGALEANLRPGDAQQTKQEGEQAPAEIRTDKDLPRSGTQNVRIADAKPVRIVLQLLLSFAFRFYADIAWHLGGAPGTVLVVLITYALLGLIPWFRCVPDPFARFAGLAFGMAIWIASTVAPGLIQQGSTQPWWISSRFLVWYFAVPVAALLGSTILCHRSKIPWNVAPMIPLPILLMSMYSLFTGNLPLSDPRSWWYFSQSGLIPIAAYLGLWLADAIRKRPGSEPHPF